MPRLKIGPGGRVVPLERTPSERRRRPGRRPELNTYAWQKLRAAVVERDGACVYCGQGPGDPSNPLGADHLVPVSQGGEALPPLEGLVCACRRCNSRKGG